jgi:hypothetical protein
MSSPFPPPSLARTHAVDGYMTARPYMVGPGNHEAECHSPACILDATLRDGLGNFSAYNARWKMPFASSNATSNMWYSFRYGSIHFVMYDTETDFPGAPGDGYITRTGGFGDQLAWLQADLAAAAADREAGLVSWIVACGHRPFYSRVDANASGIPKSDSTPAIQAAFEPLFNQYNVSLVISGHQHAYESVWPTFNGAVYRSFNQPPFPTYIVSGSAGCDEGNTNYNNSPVQPWERLSIDNEFGISQMVFLNESALTFTFRRGSDGSVLDSWTLTR